jgi:hypothetical protein
MGNHQDSGCCVGDERGQVQKQQDLKVLSELAKSPSKPLRALDNLPRSEGHGAEAKCVLTKLSELEAQNADLESAKARLMEHIAELQAENDSFKASAADRWKARKEKDHQRDADGFPFPPPRGKEVPSLSLGEGTPTQRRHTTAALVKPQSPIVKVSPRCEFYRIGGRKSVDLQENSPPKQVGETESDSDSDTALTGDTADTWRA